MKTIKHSSTQLLTPAVIMLTTLLTTAFSTPGCAQSAKPRVSFETTAGNFTLELYPDKAPDTVRNFLGYAERGFYENTVFHRVIKDFVVQGGGFDGKMTQKKTSGTVKNEADNGLKNNTGTVAMARTSDPHSASSQFFINLKNNDFLNHTGKNPQGWGYCVFGEVVKGMDTVNKIARAQTTTLGPYRDVPKEPIVVKRVVVEK